MNERLERIEKLMLVDLKCRIERLEEQVKDLRDLLAVKWSRIILDMKWEGTLSGCAFCVRNVPKSG